MTGVNGRKLKSPTSRVREVGLLSWPRLLLSEVAECHLVGVSFRQRKWRTKVCHSARMRFGTAQRRFLWADGADATIACIRDVDGASGIHCHAERQIYLCAGSRYIVAVVSLSAVPGYSGDNACGYRHLADTHIRTIGDVD